MKESALAVIRSGAIVIAALLVGHAAGGSEKPTPTPTPRPSGGQSLNEVAKDKELKGKEDGQPIVISNENLSDYSEKGELTTPHESGKPSTARRPVRGGAVSGGTAVRVVDANDPSIQENELRRYWRGKYEQELNRLEALQRLANQLDSEIPGLWRDFYSRDDPMYRDGVIKPRLDAALQERERLEEQIREAEPRLNQIKEDARKAGAEPGWFRGLSVPTPAGPTPTPNIVIDAVN